MLVNFCLALEGTIMVTGYDDDDDTSSCDENTETEVRWGKS